MRIKSRNPRATIVGLVGSGLSGVWRAYSAFTTAKSVPEDLQGVAGVLADPGFWPWVFLAAFLLLLGWSVWPTKEEPEPAGPSNRVDTLGDYSPAFAGVSVGGDFNYGVAQDSKDRSERPRRCPETPIAEALAYITAHHSREEALRMLQQAFSDDRVEVWGRPEIPPQTFSAPICADDIWKPIKPTYWDEFRLTDAAFEPNEDQPQTVARPHLRKALLRRFWAIKVDPEDLRKEWPQEEGNAFKQRVAQEESRSSALPNMPIAEVVARVKGLKGYDDQAVHEAIVDGAYHEKVHVWGRLVRGKPAKLVWRDAWENGTFDLAKGTVVYRPPDNPNAQYEWSGLMFNRLEVYRWMPLTGPTAWMAG